MGGTQLSAYLRADLAAVVGPEVLALVERKLEEGRAAWPELEIDASAFSSATARFLIRALPVGAADRLHLTLNAADATELACAAACAARASGADQLVEQRYFPAAAGALARIKLSPSLVDAALQRLREKLFLIVDGLPGLDRFVGSGRLTSFVRVAVVRDAISLLRAEARAPDLTDDGIVEILAPFADPEVHAINAELQLRFRAAFEQAVATLQPRQRNCLRLHVLEAVTLDELAAMYGVHRATVARWLDAARTALDAKTREFLRSDLDLTDPEVDSMLRTLQSKLEISFDRILAFESPG